MAGVKEASAHQKPRRGFDIPFYCHDGIYDDQRLMKFIFHKCFTCDEKFLNSAKHREHNDIEHGKEMICYRCRNPVTVLENHILPIPSEYFEENIVHEEKNEKPVNEVDIDLVLQVANSIADLAGRVLRKYFRTPNFMSRRDEDESLLPFILEECLASFILHNFPSHSIFGNKIGWKENSSKCVWILDSLDSPKNYVTGNPDFCTINGLLVNGRPIIGILDQPILYDRWVGIINKKTTFNGQEICTRPCSNLKQAFMYSDCPHLFRGKTENAFDFATKQAEKPIYSSGCYQYGLLSAGFVDAVISFQRSLEILPMLPIIEGAGGLISDFQGKRLLWGRNS